MRLKWTGPLLRVEPSKIKYTFVVPELAAFIPHTVPGTKALSIVNPLVPPLFYNANGGTQINIKSAGELVIAAGDDHDRFEGRRVQCQPDRALKQKLQKSKKYHSEAALLLISS